MTTQHKALVLAANVGDMASKFVTPSHERGVCNGAMQELRAQHALIVQMREALQAAQARARVGYDGLPQGRGISMIDKSLAAADKYLGEQA